MIHTTQGGQLRVYQNGNLLATPALDFTASEFVTGLGSGSAVTMIFGPHQSTQALYYTTFAGGGQVRRISFVTN